MCFQDNLHLLRENKIYKVVVSILTVELPHKGVDFVAFVVGK